MTLESDPTFEWRYPFLDRELMSFCFAIPREQMVRPHERRSLMRRALAATVPRQILDRKRKAYVSRALVKVIAGEYRRLRGSKPLLVEEQGIVDARRLERAVHDAEQGRDVATVSLLRTLALEDWLRNLRSRQPQSREWLFPKDCVIRVVRCSDQELLGREN
jgi:asparagine synthase (glutamine-hydrolysing)